MKSLIKKNRELHDFLYFIIVLKDFHLKKIFTVAKCKTLLVVDTVLPPPSRPSPLTDNDNLNTIQTNIGSYDVIYELTDTVKYQILYLQFVCDPFFCIFLSKTEKWKNVLRTDLLFPVKNNNHKEYEN
ncbi:hypothetical protein KUTeg_004186 [Tegillarca granosa]|uniref:Uncharacterized protein n=1 Tax=Tegillarca granosa TaxID=220873 RepID=A0ABQ9FTR2_TEGGR|nr:hypothetical protein KUTeg_004186 [Tegillarca granosa]